jgi:hypothetical protein
VDLHQVENTRRPKQPDHHLSPFDEIGQPPERPYAGVDDVEASTGERFSGGVPVRADKFSIDRAIPRQLGRDLDGGRREVEADHSRAVPSPRQGVRSEMALEMHEVQAGDICELDEFEGADVSTACSKSDQVVQIARSMERYRLVPSGHVRGTALGTSIRHNARLEEPQREWRSGRQVTLVKTIDRTPAVSRSR